MLYGFTPSNSNLTGRFVPGRKHSPTKATKQLALWSGKYLKSGEVIVAIISMNLVNRQLAVLNPGSLVNRQLTVLNPGRLGDAGCICCTPM